MMLIIELCLGGSLPNYLRNNKGKMTMDCKLRFGVESAAGLAYLERQNFIHREIA
jgi:serine/threonine protein kinase